MTLSEKMQMHRETLENVHASIDEWAENATNKAFNHPESYDTRVKFINFGQVFAKAFASVVQRTQAAQDAINHIPGKIFDAIDNKSSRDASRDDYSKTLTKRFSGQSEQAKKEGLFSRLRKATSDMTDETKPEKMKGADIFRAARIKPVMSLDPNKKPMTRENIIALAEIFNKSKTNSEFQQAVRKQGLNWSDADMDAWEKKNPSNLPFDKFAYNSNGSAYKMDLLKDPVDYIKNVANKNTTEIRRMDPYREPFHYVMAITGPVMNPDGYSAEEAFEEHKEFSRKDMANIIARKDNFNIKPVVVNGFDSVHSTTEPDIVDQKSSDIFKDTPDDF